MARGGRGKTFSQLVRITWQFIAIAIFIAQISISIAQISIFIARLGIFIEDMSHTKPTSVRFLGALEINIGYMLLGALQH